MSRMTLLTDLAYDLKDRGLLPVVFVLIAAFAAVAFMVMRGSDTPPPPPPSAASADDAQEVQAAVFADVPTLRDSRKRLESRKRKNPFRQQFASPKSVEALEESTAVTSGSSSGSSTGSSTTSSTGSSSGGTAPSTPPASKPGSSTTETEIRLITYNLDVLAGPVGETRRIKDVELAAFLPGNNKPLLQLVAITPNANKAIFAVARSVSATTGEGRCFPDGATCDFLMLEKSEARRLVWDVDGRTYRIKLLEINEVINDISSVEDFDASSRARERPRAETAIPD